MPLHIIYSESQSPGDSPSPSISSSSLAPLLPLPLCSCLTSDWGPQMLHARSPLRPLQRLHLPGPPPQWLQGCLTLCRSLFNHDPIREPFLTTLYQSSNRQSFLSLPSLNCSNFLHSTYRICHAACLFVCCLSPRGERFTRGDELLEKRLLHHQHQEQGVAKSRSR